MKKKTLNQQLGFTPVVKEEVFTFNEEPFISMPTDYYNPYHKHDDFDNGRVMLSQYPQSKEKYPIFKLLLAMSIGALVGFSIVYLFK